MTMKRKIFYLVLAVLALGLFASSCNKVDLLEGAVWVHHPDENNPDLTWTLSFVNKVEVSYTVTGGAVTVRGEYYGEKDKITLLFYGTSEFTGTIKDDKMTIRNPHGDTYIFKKKK